MTPPSLAQRLPRATPLYRRAQIRALEQRHEAAGLMEKAGLAVAQLSQELLQKEGGSILVVAGPGNNGGDALVAARLLAQSWHSVTVVLAAAPEQLPPDAARACDAWLAAGGSLHRAIPAQEYDLVIDGLFGIGLSRPLTGGPAALVEAINTITAPVLAVDIPSGLCADTGAVLGCAVRASHTLTLLGRKPGLYTHDGPDHAGMVHVDDLQLPDLDAPAADGWLLQRPMFAPPLAPRRRNTHKKHYGSLAVVGGADGMLGAALLAARAGLLLGAGRVYAGLLSSAAPALDPLQPELMLAPPQALLARDDCDALVLGPGLGSSSAAQELLARAIAYPAPLLLDADALNLLAGHPALRAQVAARTWPTVVTPHPGEAARLLAVPGSAIQADRIASALAIAHDLNAITVLKGAGSIVALPDARWFINPSGNPGMSSAGMGDSLSGMLGALLAQGIEADYATLLGVHLHGAAADMLVGNGIGPVGLTAHEVSHAARTLLNQWQRDACHP